MTLRADEPAFGQWIVQGDAQRLRQLLLILLDNAIRYSHDGGTVRLTVRSGALSGDGNRSCCVEVHDGGIGIAPHELAQVFDRHFRGQDARRQRPDGSGLGLPIAQSLANAHGGRIDLSSSQEEGTIARLTLPAIAATAAIPHVAKYT